MAEWKSRSELIDQIRTTSVRLELLIAQLSVAQMNQPGAVGAWSVKDALAHLAFWQRYAASLIVAVASGETPDRDVRDETETRNASVVAQYYQRPLGLVIADWQQAREELIERVQEIADEDLNDPSRCPWNDGRPLWPTIAANSYAHEQEHIDQIRAWMRQLS
jgi:hypothetical protein